MPTAGTREEETPVEEYLLNMQGINKSFFGNPVLKNVDFAVKKGENAALIQMFNDGLANIKANGTYDEILAKYGY